MTLEARLRIDRGAFTLNAGLRFDHGETVAVVGPNGAGKSTLLRGLAGIVPLNGGHIRLNGRTLDDPAEGIYLPPEKRPIGVVFQDLLLMPHLSALENVAFGLRCRGIGKHAARQKAAAWLDRFGLAGHASRKPRELSGGQAQRVALAITPGLLLMDEPLSALDVATRTDARHDLRQALAAFTGIRLIITHDPTEALTLADRIVILQDGQIRQTGTPAEIIARPGSAYVATFVGVNLLRGKAHDHTIALEGGLSLTIAEHAEGEIYALIHPRAVALHAQEPGGSPRNAWQGHIHSIDIARDTARVTIAGNPQIVAEITPAATADLAIAPGVSIWISVKATEITTYPV